MIDAFAGLVWSSLALSVFAVLLLLPGLWLARRLGPADDVRVVAVLSVLLSLLLLAAVSAALLLSGRFDPRIVAWIAIGASVISVGTSIRWLKTLGGQAIVLLGAGVLVALPWLAGVVRSDLAPANTLQWYYWDLGRALTGAGAIPGAVSEFGAVVPWLPDYLFFNGLSEAYSTLMAPAGAAVAMQVWRVPLALAGLGSLYLVARLWLDQVPSVVAVAAAGASVFFITKFNAYKPESLGIVVGLLAAWLIVMGLRDRRAVWMALGGAALGVDVAIHAIAATLAGMVLAGAVLAEILMTQGDRRRPLLLLAGTAVIAILVVVGTGVALQGRPLVATEALRPAAGRPLDPTWTYLQYSNGVFTDQPPPPLLARLASGVRSPWPGVLLGTLKSLWLVWLVGLGVFLSAVFGDRRVRAGLLSGVIAGAVLGAAIGVFALAFSTYVPQHTGLVRFAQYIPAGFGFVVGFGAQGYLLSWQRITGSGPGRWFDAIASVVALGLLVTVSGADYRADLGIPAEGRAAIAELGRLANARDVVLSNALTSGQLEFFTEVEALLEGRQPLIERPAFLDQANAVLLAAHQFFGPEHDAAVLSDLHVRWVLVVDDPHLLGAGASLGGDVAQATLDPRLSLRWQAPGVGLFEVVSPG